jgi:hypothetical protein
MWRIGTGHAGLLEKQKLTKCDLNYSLQSLNQMGTFDSNPGGSGVRSAPRFFVVKTLLEPAMPRTTRRKRILWTADELKTLRKLAGKDGVRKIARQLKRSEAAVRFKAWQKRIKLAVKKASGKKA